MKVLLVGLGWFGKKHYNVWNDLGVEIVGVFEKKGFSISQNDEQSKYHKEVVEHTDISQITFFDELKQLEKLDFDCVDITTNENSHFEYAKYFLRIGKKVIIEKPIALNYEEVKELRKIALENDTFFYAGHILRFDSRTIEVKKRIKNFELRFGKFERNFQNQALKKYGSVPTLYTALIHDLDLFNFLFSPNLEEINEIQYKYLSNKNYQADLVTAVSFKYNQALLLFSNCWLVSEVNEYGFISNYQLYSETMNIEQQNTPDIKIYEKTLEVPDLFFWNHTYYPGGALRRMLNHYKKCIESNVESDIASMKSIENTYQLIHLILEKR